MVPQSIVGGRSAIVWKRYFEIELRSSITKRSGLKVKNLVTSSYGVLKSQVSLTPRENLQELCHKILLVFERLLNNPNFVYNSVMAMEDRVQKSL